MNPSRHFRYLSHEEARRALYIDFEGEKGKPPVLLGVHRRGRGERPFVHHDLLDPVFEPLGEHRLSLRDAIDIVVRRAEANDRRIVAWSEHELSIVRALLADDPELVEQFERRFANARAFAERWRNRVHGGSKPTHGSLPSYLELIERRVPGGAEGGTVGRSIRVLRDALLRGRLTAAHRARWARVLEHNRSDCAGMRAVCLVASAEIDADAEAATRPDLRDAGRTSLGVRVATEALPY